MWCSVVSFGILSFFSKFREYQFQEEGERRLKKTKMEKRRFKKNGENNVQEKVYLFRKELGYLNIHLYDNF
jgi:hypothetical protein